MKIRGNGHSGMSDAGIEQGRSLDDQHHGSDSSTQTHSDSQGMDPLQSHPPLLLSCLFGCGRTSAWPVGPSRASHPLDWSRPNTAVASRTPGILSDANAPAMRPHPIWLGSDRWQERLFGIDLIDQNTTSNQDGPTGQERVGVTCSADPLR